MTTTLMLDAPEAQAALGRAYALLRRWAREAEEEQETADGARVCEAHDPSAAGGGDHGGRRRVHATPEPATVQIREV